MSRLTFFLPLVLHEAMHKISLIHAFIVCSPVSYKWLRFQVLDVCLLGMEQYKNLDLSLLSRKAEPFNLILTRGKHVWCLTDVHYKDSCSLKSFLIMTCHHPQDHFESKDAIQWKTQINLIHKQSVDSDVPCLIWCRSQIFASKIFFMCWLFIPKYK